MHRSFNGLKMRTEEEIRTLVKINGAKATSLMDILLKSTVINVLDWVLGQDNAYEKIMLDEHRNKEVIENEN